LVHSTVDEAVRHGGAIATTIGFIAGAAVYVAANALLDRHGARHRKRSGDQQPSEDQQPGSGAAIAIGALLDGIPESVVLGLSLIGGGGVSPRGSRRDLQVPEPDYRC
jgi:zinc transporter, ZIP family